MFFRTLPMASSPVSGVCREFVFASDDLMLCCCDDVLPAAAGGSGRPNEGDCKYVLKGVLVHSGTANTGHYYSLIKEVRALYTRTHTNRGIWVCFDDVRALYVWQRSPVGQTIPEDQLKWFQVCD
jgi:hypothetical protein